MRARPEVRTKGVTRDGIRHLAPRFFQDGPQTAHRAPLVRFLTSLETRDVAQIAFRRAPKSHGTTPKTIQNYLSPASEIPKTTQGRPNTNGVSHVTALLACSNHRRTEYICRRSKGLQGSECMPHDTFFLLIVTLVMFFILLLRPMTDSQNSNKHKNTKTTEVYHVTTSSTFLPASPKTAPPKARHVLRLSQAWMHKMSHVGASVLPRAKTTENARLARWRYLPRAAG